MPNDQLVSGIKETDNKDFEIYIYHEQSVSFAHGVVVGVAVTLAVCILLAFVLLSV